MYLEKQNREVQTAGSQIEMLQTQIREARDERDALQREFDKIMQQPYFKREHDPEALKKMNEVEKQIDEKRLDQEKSRANILKYEKEIKE